MDCAHHPGTTATALCTRCNTLLCSQCAEQRNGRDFCAKCAEFLDRRSTERTPAAASPPSAGPPGADAPGADDGLYQGPPPPGPGSPAGETVYQGPPPGPGSPAQGSLYQGPPPSPGSPAVAGGAAGSVYGDVYQGEAPQDDVYQGETPRGDVYQGDVYQGEAAQSGVSPGGSSVSSSGVPVTVTLTDEAREKGSTGRAVLFGAVAAGISAVVWYGAVVLTGYQFGFLAIVIGGLVGVATTAGAGRGDTRVALLSLAIAAVSMLGGVYLINDHFYRKFTTFELQAEEAFADGDISDEDMALYFDTSVSELHSELSGDELEEMRQYIAEEVSGGDEDSLEAALAALDEPEQPAHLPLGELFFWMDWWEFVFIGIGAFTPFRVPASGEVG